MIDTEALRKKVIDLAIQGKLTEQLPSDGDAESLYAQIQEEKAKLIKEGKIKKDKALLPISDDEILFDIPSNWRWVRLADISSVISKGTTPRGGNVAYLDVGIGFLRVENLAGYDKLDTSCLKYIDEETHNGFLKRSVLEAGDVLISIAGTLGRTGLVREENLPLNTNQAIAFIRIAEKNSVDAEYISYILNSVTVQKELGNKKVAMAIPNLSLEVISKAIIPLPPSEEQKRIVEVIRQAFVILDDIDTLQQQYESDLSVLKSKIIDAGIRGKLTKQLPEDGAAEALYTQIQEEKAKLIKEGKIKKEKPLLEIDTDELPFEIPDNWKWVRLGDICSKISSGNTPTGGSKGGAYVEKGFCFFREQNIYNDGIHNEGMVFISEELLNSRPNSTVLAKDILLNITGGSIGRCALIPDDFSKGSTNQHILIIRPLDSNIRFYVHQCLCSPYFQSLIMGNVVGDKDGFSAGRCKNAIIPIPPLEEQKRITKTIDELLQIIG